MLRLTSLARMVIFTEQSPVLQQAANSLSLSSNIWIEDWVLKPELRRNFDLVAPEGLQPTAVTVWKSFEVYNSDQLISKDTKEPAGFEMEATQDTSYSSKKPYGKIIAKDMEAVRQSNSYNSKWWIGVNNVARPYAPFELRDSNERAHKFFILTRQQLYPLNKLEGAHAERLLALPISGATRRYMREEFSIAQTLEQVARERGYKGNLYFTERQLEMAFLELKPDEEVIEVNQIFDADANALASGFSSNNTKAMAFRAFNIEQLEGWENVLASLGRYGTPAIPVFLFSGLEVKNENILKEHEIRKFTQNYWFTGKDVEQNGWVFKDGEEHKGVALGKYTTRFYNVEQLENPEEGYSKAGLLTMKASMRPSME